MIGPVGTTPDHPPHPDGRLDRCGDLRQSEQPIPVKMLQQPGTIDPGEWMFPVAFEQIERTPSEFRRLSGPPILEEPAAIIDVLPPLRRWHAPRWAVGIEPRETLSPSARDSSAVFDKCRAFILIVVRPAAIGSKMVFIGVANDS